MDVRFWACEAHTGDVIAELPSAGSSSFTLALGGGRAQLEIPLGHLTKKDGSPDLGACQRVLDSCAPGARTVAVTAGETVLGEWLIMRRSRGFADGTVKISGLEWDAYPPQRQVHTQRFISGDVTGSLAKTLLQDLFSGQNGNITVSVPTVNSGLSGSIRERVRTRYYSDVLSELEGQAPGFEWRVDVAGTWNAGALTKVNRTVAFGVPTLSRGTVIPVGFPEPGGRQGAGLAVSVAEDFELQASAMYVSGAGDGAKRVTGAYSDGAARVANGWVSRTRVYPYPGIGSKSVADRLAKKISDASQSIWVADDVEFLADKVPTLPRVGGRVRVLVPPTFVLPAGYERTLRVGEMVLDVDAGRVDVVKVRAAQEGVA